MLPKEIEPGEPGDWLHQAWSHLRALRISYKTEKRFDFLAAFCNSVLKA
jgi:hypothetical protein